MKYIITESQSNAFVKNLEKVLNNNYNNKDICGIEVEIESNIKKERYNSKINVYVFVSEKWKPRQNEELYKIRKEIMHDLKSFFKGGNFYFSVMINFENCEHYSRKKERLLN